LAHAEKGVRDEDPIPARSPHEQKRYGDRHQPARDEHLLAPEVIGELPGEIVRERLGHAEHDDE
jgi:hypothetical protein